MRILISLLLSTSLAGAGMLPVLTEPRVFPILETGKISTIGDTAYLSLSGKLDLFRRTNDQILKVDSVYIPNSVSWGTVLPNAEGGAFVVQDSIYSIESRYFSKVAIGVPKFEINSMFLQQVGAYSLGWETLILSCGYLGLNQAIVRQGSIEANDSFSISNISRGCGFTERYGVLAQQVGNQVGVTGKYYVTYDSISRLFSDVKNPGRTEIVDTLHADSLVWISANKQGSWLAFVQSQGAFYWGNMPGKIAHHIDSIRVPELVHPDLFGTNSASVLDSLVAFGLNNVLVLGKWTSSTFQIISQTDLGNRYIQSTGLARTGVDSKGVELWVSTSDGLYNFKVDWQDQQSSVRSRSNGVLKLDIHPVEGGATFSWKGAPQRMEIMGLDGRVASSLDLVPGVVSWKAPHPGVFLARTPEGSKSFVIR